MHRRVNDCFVGAGRRLRVFAGEGWLSDRKHARNGLILHIFKWLLRGLLQPPNSPLNQHTCTFSCSRPTKNPPDTDPGPIVGAFVGKLSLGGSDGGSRPGWGMAIGEIWHTSSRLWVSIDYIIVMHKLQWYHTRAPPWHPFAYMPMCATLNKLVMRESRDL